MKRAQLVFDMLVERRITPDVITYTMMINGYCRVNCLRKAHDIFNDMKEKGIKPDVIAITIVLDAHSKVNLKMACSLQFSKGSEEENLGLPRRHYHSVVYQHAVSVKGQLVQGQLCCPFFPYFSPQAVHTSFLNLIPSFLILAHNCFLISPFIILYS